MIYNIPMIATIRGTVTGLGDRYAVIETGGIGYKVFMTGDAIQAARIGAEAALWTHMAVREDAMDIYGFPSGKERDFFELLLTVSGIGPRSALNILSAASAEALAGSVRSGSVAHLIKISGLGRKTAEKLVLELKDKLGGFGGTGADGHPGAAGASSDIDALEALRSLGYDADEAREAIKKVSSGRDAPVMDAAAKVKAALKALS